MIETFPSIILHFNHFLIKMYFYSKKKLPNLENNHHRKPIVTVLSSVIRLCLASAALWLPTFTLVLSLEKMPWLMSASRSPSTWAPRRPSPDTYASEPKVRWVTAAAPWTQAQEKNSQCVKELSFGASSCRRRVHNDVCNRVVKYIKLVNSSMYASFCRGWPWASAIRSTSLRKRQISEAAFLPADL